MNIFSKLSLFAVILSITSVSLYAGYQDGKYIPDEVQILNDTDKVMTIEGARYAPNQTAKLSTQNQKGRIMLSANGTMYTVFYPIYNPAGSVKQVFSVQNEKLSDIIARQAGRTVGGRVLE